MDGSSREKDESMLSIVVTARNDNHGGNLLHRMQIFVNGILVQSEKQGLRTELILVEWNPPPDKPRLAEALSWPERHDFCTLRIIEVPPEIHQRYKHSNNLPLYQMIAKNVGIRRARSEFILATNIDILFSHELMRFLASGALEKGYIYRIDRYDVPEDVPLDASIEGQLEYCRKNVIRINSLDGTRNLITGDYYPSRLPPVMSSTCLHFNSSGDFTLMHKEHWFALRGYPEFEMYSFHLDTLLLLLAHYGGVRQKTLSEPMRIYHIEHTSGFRPEAERRLTKDLDSRNVTSLTLAEIERWAIEMSRNGHPIIFNRSNWGLADNKLGETIIFQPDLSGIKQKHKRTLKTKKKKTGLPEQKRILIVSEQIPQFDTSLVDGKLFQVIKCLSKYHSVTFLAQKKIMKERYAEELKKIGVVVFYDIKKVGQSNIPTQIVGMTDIRTLLAHNSFDAVMFESQKIAGVYLQWIRKLSPQSVIIIDTFNDTIFEEEKAKQISIYEKDMIITSSESERDQILKESPNLDVRTLPKNSRTLEKRLLQMMNTLPHPKERQTERFKIYANSLLKLSASKELTVILIVEGDQARAKLPMWSLVLNSDKEISEIIIAIDNKVRDEIIKEAERNFVKYFIYENEKELNAFCIRILNDCSSPYFGLVKSDIIVPPYWDRRLISHLKEDSGILAVSPMVTHFSYSSMYDFEKAAWDFYEKYRGIHMPCESICTSCIVVNKCAIKNKGNYTFTNFILNMGKENSKITVAKDTLVSQLKPNNLNIQSNRANFKKPETKLVSVIIPTYNEKDSLLECLYSFFHQNLDPDQLEIIVVDGGSGDGTIEALSRLNPSCTFRHFVLPRNGKASAANFGITEASGKFILLSSPNIVAKDDLISQYLKNYEYRTYENTAIVGNILPEEDEGFAEGIRNGRNVFNLFLRRKSFEETGLFDESLDYQWLNTEFVFRLIAKGYQIKNDDRIVAYVCNTKKSSTDIFGPLVKAGNEFADLMYAHPNIRLCSFDTIKEKIVEYFIDKEKELVELAKNIAGKLQKIPENEQVKFRLGSLPLTVVCNRILSNYYYYKGIYEEICRVEGEDWLKNFVDRKKIDSQMLKEAIFAVQYLMKSSLHKGRGDVDKAVYMARKANEVRGAPSFFSSYWLGACYLNAGKLMEAENLFEEAIKNADKASPLMETRREDIVCSYLYLALSCMYQTNYAKAIDVLKRLVYERIPISLPEKAIIYDLLSKCYRKMGKGKEAYIFEKHAREFKKETDIAILEAGWGLA